MSNGHQSGLKADIAAVTIFGEVVPFESEISDYLGHPLYISAVAVDAQNNLVFTIDDQGPPACAPPAFEPAPAAAIATLSFGGMPPVSTLPTKQPLKYTGGPVTLSATLVVGSDLALDVQPAIAQYVAPDKTRDVVPIYVVVTPPGEVSQLRWIEPPITVSAVPTTVRIIPAASGSSSLGPFGIQTP